MNSLRVPAGKASMKRMLALSILLLCSMASAQGKYRWGHKPTSQNPDDYSIKVHISATHFRTFCSGNSPCSNGVYLDAVLDGQNVELFGNLDKHQSEQIELGDYLAMLPQKPPYAGLAVVGQRYYVLLPDRSAWVCHITGLSE